MSESGENLSTLSEFQRELISKKNDPPTGTAQGVQKLFVSFSEFIKIVIVQGPEGVSSFHLDSIYYPGEAVEPEALNKKALDIVQRVRDKLTGKDFNKEVSVSLLTNSLIIKYWK